MKKACLILSLSLVLTFSWVLFANGDDAISSPATPGKHLNEKCTVMFLGNADGTDLRALFSGRITSDDFFLLEDGKMSAKDLSAFSLAPATEAVKQNKGSAVFKDYILDYEVGEKIGRSFSATITKAQSEGKEEEGFRPFPDYEAMGAHQKRKCTVRFQKGSGEELNVDFMYLLPKDSDDWPRSGTIIVKEGQELFPLAEIREEFSSSKHVWLMKRFIIDYEIVEKSSKGPDFSYAKITKVVPLNN